VSHAPSYLNSLQSSRNYWWTIQRGIDRQSEMIHLHIGRTARTTLGPPRTERSIFRTLRGTVPAQAAGVLPGTPDCTPQAHPQRAFFFGIAVSILQLERGVDDRQTGNPHGLASCGMQVVVAVEVAEGKASDYVIPLNEKHLRRILREWVVHYNQGRPHSSLGPGIPELCEKPRRKPEVKGHQRLAGSESRMSSEGCTTNIGWKKGLRENRCCFCGAHIF